jgi:hypothetical protein
MTGRYEIRDSHYPRERGMRFADLARARRELARAVPPGRFHLYDRETREVIGHYR